MDLVLTCFFQKHQNTQEYILVFFGVSTMCPWVMYVCTYMCLSTHNFSVQLIHYFLMEKKPQFYSAETYLLHVKGLILTKFSAASHSHTFCFLVLFLFFFSLPCILSKNKKLITETLMAC